MKAFRVIEIEATSALMGLLDYPMESVGWLSFVWSDIEGELGKWVTLVDGELVVIPDGMAESSICGAAARDVLLFSDGHIHIDHPDELDRWRVRDDRTGQEATSETYAGVLVAALNWSGGARKKADEQPFVITSKLPEGDGE